MHGIQEDKTGKKRVRAAVVTVIIKHIANAIALARNLQSDA